jgi:hypothetical protein
VLLFIPWWAASHRFAHMWAIPARYLVEISLVLCNNILLMSSSIQIGCEPLTKLTLRIAIGNETCCIFHILGLGVIHIGWFQVTGVSVRFYKVKFEMFLTYLRGFLMTPKL